MRIALLSFGQFAGTHFYYDLAKHLGAMHQEVTMATDARSGRRIGAGRDRHSPDVQCLPFSYDSIREFVLAAARDEAFVLFSSLLFALPCIDLVKGLNYAIQSTAFSRSALLEASADLFALPEDHLRQRLSEAQPSQWTGEWAAALRVFYDLAITPGYASLYSMDAAQPAPTEFVGRGSFYRMVCAHPLLAQCEKVLFTHSRVIYSYYREEHKMAFLRQHYPEFAGKLSHLVPSVDICPEQSSDEALLEAKRQSHIVLFFCGEQEFHHWKGELALAVLGLLPRDFRLVVLGQIPNACLQALPDAVRSRLSCGIVDNFEEVRALGQSASVLLAINRQSVSYSVLEAMSFSTPCVFSKSIVSHGHGVIDRVENDAGVYVEEDSAAHYAEAIFRLTNDRAAYQACVARQHRFLSRNFDIGRVARQFVNECIADRSSRAPLGFAQPTPPLSGSE